MACKVTAVEGAIEFIIIFVGFYLLLKIPDFARGIRGTKFLIFGISAIVIAGLWLSEYLGAGSINLIIKWLALGLCIIYLATFLPEIRRGVFALVARLSPAESMGVHEKFQKEFTDTVYTLSKKGTKGLVILEKTLDVDRYIKDFIKIDAMFSYALLESLFSYDSPFKNGAVVIKGNRIALATGHSSLLEGLPHEKKYDPPHLAAISITQSTDAIAVVLSGDGNVSFVGRGEVKGNFLKHEMETRLKEEFGIKA